MLGLERSSVKLDGALKTNTLSTGRLGNQFSNLAARIAHVHPIVGNLSNVLLDFAVGGAVTAGVLGGLALIAVGYDKLTESTRKAKEETNKFVKELVDQARAAREATVAGAELNQLRAEIELQDAKKASGVGIRSVIGAIVTGKPGLDPTDAAAAAKRIADAQTAVEQSIIRTAKAHENANKPIKETLTTTGKIKDTFNAVRDAAEEYQLQQQIAAIKLRMVLEELQKIAALHAEIAGYTKFTGMPNVSMPFEGLDKNEKKQLQELGILTDTTEESGNKVRDAIWGSATQMANQIVSALNVGGGGKGSNLGGALGGTAGFAAGFMLGGPIGGAIGSTIGNIAGSLFGGLFDSNKKAVNENTNAVRANTAVMNQILNSPSGFKIAQARYDATDVSQLGQDLRRYRARGGRNPLLAGT